MSPREDPGKRQVRSRRGVINFSSIPGGAVAQLGARLDGIEEVVGSNPIGSTKKTSLLFASILVFPVS